VKMPSTLSKLASLAKGAPGPGDYL